MLSVPFDKTDIPSFDLSIWYSWCRTLARKMIDPRLWDFSTGFWCLWGKKIRANFCAAKKSVYASIASECFAGVKFYQISTRFATEFGLSVHALMWLILCIDNLQEKFSRWGCYFSELFANSKLPFLAVPELWQIHKEDVREPSCA